MLKTTVLPYVTSEVEVITSEVTEGEYVPEVVVAVESVEVYELSGVVAFDASDVTDEA